MHPKLGYLYYVSHPLGCIPLGQMEETRSLFKSRKNEYYAKFIKGEVPAKLVSIYF